MAITKVYPASWAFGEKLTAAQMNSFDTKLITAADKTAAGDTILGPWAFSGAGRFIPTVTLGADANTAYTAGSGNSVIRVTSSVTADRVYTLSASGAATNDVITIYAEPSFGDEISIRDQGGTEIYVLGTGTTTSGLWATFIYIGGWRVLHSDRGGPGQASSFTTPGTTSWTCPPGVTTVIVTGCGGGGGGGGGGDGTASTGNYPRGGGGGASALISTRVLTGLTPGSAYDVIVGAGGTGGPAATTGAAGTGGDSSFAGSVISVGALGGYGNTSVASNALVARGGEASVPVGLVVSLVDSNSYGPPLAHGMGGHGGSGNMAARGGSQGHQSAGGSAGAQGAVSGSHIGGGGGGGGAGGFSTGANGGAGGAGNNAGAGAAGTAGSASFAGGGGGGGGGAGGCGSVSGGAGAAGGAGGPGFVTITWIR